MAVGNVLVWSHHASLPLAIVAEAFVGRKCTRHPHSLSDITEAVDQGIEALNVVSAPWSSNPNHTNTLRRGHGGACDRAALRHFGGWARCAFHLVFRRGCRCLAVGNADVTVENSREEFTCTLGACLRVVIACTLGARLRVVIARMMLVRAIPSRRGKVAVRTSAIQRSGIVLTDMFFEIGCIECTFTRGARRRLLVEAAAMPRQAIRSHRNVAFRTSAVYLPI